jgi:WW domain-binding protein 4
MKATHITGTLKRMVRWKSVNNFLKILIYLSHSHTESIWEKPKEGYMTLKEYEKLNQLAIKQQEESVKKDQQYHVENAEELAARLKREQFKKYQKITQEKKSVKGQKAEEEEDPTASYKTSFDAYGAQPIGQWEAVEEQSAAVEAEEIDLELPKQSVAYYPVATVQTDEPPVKKFKEKTITSLDDASEVPSVFKKRKFGNRNIRRANDD